MPYRLQRPLNRLSCREQEIGDIMRLTDKIGVNKFEE